VARYLECQQVKAEHRHPAGLLQPHVIPEFEIGSYIVGFYCWIATTGEETGLDL
jgi:hypothetical protein